ncbi:Hypothetical predicted protein [Cloeon dipterum]|uniref:Protein SYS1 homolog n=1 Tax=Cloeon dipterum TaxID=197152 RepID=A0A8S1CG50_9INSE|nr:Hypothetical predicted protein [Cloeon dipterum]
MNHECVARRGRDGVSKDVQKKNEDGWPIPQLDVGPYPDHLADLCPPVSGLPRSLDCLFSYQYIHVRDNTGQLVITSFVINSLTGALALWFIVQRTKQCLDFSATAHLIHLFVCWSYNGYFPVSMSWWVLNTVCLAIMCVCGEFLCMRTELKSIPLNMGPKADL